jgi:enterochelin esterase-like enzyme
MRRRFLFNLFLTILTCGIGLAQQKAPAGKPGVRLDFSVPPVAPPNAPPGTAHPNPLNIYGAQYPKIEADNRVTFRFTAPNAQKVQVGLVTPGQNSLAPIPVDMVKGADGVWTYTSAPQSPGYHNYWMFVDGAPVLDTATNGFIGYSHLCNGFEIPEPGVDWYDLKDVPHGDIRINNYYAKSIGAWRHVFVYTPPGYDGKTKIRYPVLYLQHGGGEDERVWTEMGHTNLILDNLLAAGKAKPFIVVMETSAVPGAGRGPVPGAGRGPTGPPGGAYGQLMVQDLIPWVDANYRTLPDQAHRAMAGLSMGGMQTATVTMANLDKFSHVGLFSGGAATGFGGRGGARGGAPGAAPAPPATPPPFDIKTAYNGAMADPAAFNRKVRVLFMSFGSDPPLENPEGLKRHQQNLVGAGIANSYVYISPGTTHEWQTWRRSLYAFAQLLFR